MKIDREKSRDGEAVTGSKAAFDKFTPHNGGGNGGAGGGGGGATADASTRIATGMFGRDNSKPTADPS
jgi:hypothetical protein